MTVEELYMLALEQHAEKHELRVRNEDNGGDYGTRKPDVVSFENESVVVS